jgi:hypothetical protein
MWSLILREEHIPRVFENRVLWRIFGCRTDETTGDWRKFHNGDLHTLYSLPNIIRMINSRSIKWEWYIAHMRKNAYKILVCKWQGTRKLGRSRFRWEDNIKIILREIGWRYELQSTGSRWSPVVGSSEHNKEISDSINCWNLNIWATGCFSRRS